MRLSEFSRSGVYVMPVCVHVRESVHVFSCLIVLILYAAVCACLPASIGRLIQNCDRCLCVFVCVCVLLCARQRNHSSQN